MSVLSSMTSTRKAGDCTTESESEEGTPPMEQVCVIKPDNVEIRESESCWIEKSISLVTVICVKFRRSAESAALHGHFVLGLMQQRFL